MIQSPFEQYVDYLAAKYDDKMTPWERDGLANYCGLSDIDRLTTDDEKNELMRLWSEEYEQA